MGPLNRAKSAKFNGVSLTLSRGNALARRMFLWRERGERATPSG